MSDEQNFKTINVKKRVFVGQIIFLLGSTSLVFSISFLGVGMIFTIAVVGIPFLILSPFLMLFALPSILIGCTMMGYVQCPVCSNRQIPFKDAFNCSKCKTRIILKTEETKSRKK